MLAELEREQEEREREWQRRGGHNLRAVEELKAFYAEKPWAFSDRFVKIVEDLVQVAHPTANQAKFASSLLAQAEDNVTRAEERLRAPVTGTELERVADPAVRADILRACRALSDLDEDRATYRNDRGWSQATSWTGHVLAGKEVLELHEAAHALRLVHKHRKQLSEDLRLRLFGGVA